MQRQSNSIVERSRSGLVTTRKSSYAYVEQDTPSPDRAANLDFEGVTKYFMGFWRSPHVARALSTLERYESKRMLKPLRKKYGQWCPPPEVTQVLKKPHSHHRSHLPDTKDARNLQFVLKMLGCSLHENRPYNQFLKAKSVRQKRLWMYTYMSPKSEQYEQIKEYSEPICPTRLKRLYQFFPDRFKEQNNTVYFNDKRITYDNSKRVFYFGKNPTTSSEESE